ncbi:TOPRIM nucleotidyl transferase/hydrolase domain-containing protein [Kitasatospora terrestris]|uniref:OLD protein-like TOPRIM domain-containing protein n=1 Tax=Kitasatospora terrestris TaxID=258051 RepID=A0ABP9EGR4_9ACTN
MADMQRFREAATGWVMRGAAPPDTAGVRTAVLVEGLSDLAAVEALAAGRGRDLAAEGVCVLPMGGATNIARYAELLGPPGLGLRLAGLSDEGEQGFYVRGLERAGAPSDGFFVCAADLEDELVRALGVPAVEEILAAGGDLPAWRTFVRQPAQQGRPAQRQLRRFLGTRKGRKIRYGRLLAEALTAERTPAPLRDLLAHL